MDLRKTLLAASDALAKQNIAHALIGGFALAVHGVQRATQDIDFLADGTRRTSIIDVLQGSGFVLQKETTEVLHFAGIGLLDILLANRPLSSAMLNEAKLSDRLNVRVLQVEDLIGLKIQAYCNDTTRELQDKADIQNLIRKNAGIDWSRVKTYADLFGQWAVIEKLRGSL